MNIQELINLGKDTDRKASFDTILKGMEFRGANVWMLGIAIVLASVGLNVNSTAVVIGAMLVSPLMGPIVGAGYSLGTYDLALLKKALWNLALMTGISVAVSTVYFTLSPLNVTQSELLARTGPSFFDIIIAFFGGSALMITSSRKQGATGNILAGVAIATALMPPLCTAGYGIAVRNPAYFFGAAYLYLINSVFIGLAAFVFTKLLGLQQKPADEAPRFDARHWALTIAAVLAFVAPSVWMGWDMIVGITYRTQVAAYLDAVMKFPGSTVLATKTGTEDGVRTLEVTAVGSPLDKPMISHLGRLLPDYGLSDMRLKIFQSGEAWITDRTGTVVRPRDLDGTETLPSAPAGTAAVPVPATAVPAPVATPVPAASPVPAADRTLASLFPSPSTAATPVPAEDREPFSGPGGESLRQQAAEEARLAFPDLEALSWGDFLVRRPLGYQGTMIVFARFAGSADQTGKDRFAVWLRLRTGTAGLEVKAW